MAQDDRVDFVAVDRKLEAAHGKATEALAEHRWHWTLDQSNPDRVTMREYARRIDRDEKAIRMMAHGYEAWRARTSDVRIGGPVTLHDYITQARLGTEMSEAAEAVAAATGKPFAAVSHPSKRQEVRSVLDTARDRAERRGTTVSEELPRVAEFREKGRQARQSERDARQAKRFTLVEIEGHLGAAMRRLKEALALAREVDFDDEETEVIVSSIERLKTLIALIDVRVTGENTTVDWDAEFARVMEP